MQNQTRRVFALSLFALLPWHSITYARQSASPSPASSKRVVVELFQSQGCSSCPPAEANLNAIASEPGVLALSYGVTYWDNLGWKDTFATDDFTQRQWTYAHYHRRDTVWTPQVYINGHVDLVGTDRGQLDGAIAQAQSRGPSIAWSANNVTVQADVNNHQTSDIWLVRYDPHTRQVAIGTGENAGRTLAQRNVVHELIRLGTWAGDAKTYPLPAPSASALNTAVLVQVQGGGDILSASVQETTN
jgi:hypothetical protein